MRSNKGIGILGVVSALLGFLAGAIQTFGFGIVRGEGGSIGAGLIFRSIVFLILMGIAVLSVLQSVQRQSIVRFVVIVLCTFLLPFFSVFAYLDVGYLYIPSVACALLLVIVSAGEIIMRLVQRSSVPKTAQ